MATKEFDDFSVRNGIRFGMSVDDVYQIELVENASGPKKQNDSMYYHLDNGKDVICEDTNVAGHNGATITYAFDGDGKLGEFEYNWLFYYEKPEFADVDGQFTKLRDIYDDISGKLASKYQLISSVSGHTIKYVDFNTLNEDPFYLPELDNKDTQYGFSQYLAQDGDNYVEILCRCFKMLSNDISMITSVQYRSIPKELYEQRLKEAEDTQKKIDNDL